MASSSRKRPRGREDEADQESSLITTTTWPLYHHTSDGVKSCQISENTNTCLDSHTPSTSEAGVRSRIGRSSDGKTKYPRCFNVGHKRFRIEQAWQVPAKPGGRSDWMRRKVANGDQWWDPVIAPRLRADIPSETTPNAVRALHALLSTSSNHYTRSASLCADVCHIRHAFNLDFGWGCGYRNALMIISGLLQRSQEYQHVFSQEHHGADPGVRRIQGWIEEAWAEGFDPEGQEHFKNKILGTRKWIGTSDLYAMFTYMGIPCVRARTVYLVRVDNADDFPKPREGETQARSASQRLLDWTTLYFNSSPSGRHDMRGCSDHPAGNAVATATSCSTRHIIMTSKMPFILQHSGHSRTVVGYEETCRGTINLLMFDPGRRMPKAARKMALNDVHWLPVASAPVRSQGQSLTQTWCGSGLPARPSIDSTFSSEDASYACGPRPTTITNGILSSGRWLRNRVITVAERTDDAGDVKPGKVEQILGVFRVSSERLARSKEYQILVFTGGAMLTSEQRQQRKVVRSTLT